MSINDRNRAIVKNLYEEVLNRRDMKSLGEFVSNDFQGPNGSTGPAGFRIPIETVLNAMPDAQWRILSLICEENTVVARWKVEGTNSGRFQSFGPSGNRISNDGFAIFELSDGKIVRSEVHTDRLGFLQQLNVLPQDLSTLVHQTDNVYFIDKFVVPPNVNTMFLQRMIIARDFLRRLPGLIRDAGYERTDENGNLVFISIAVWKNPESLKNAKDAVQAEYSKQVFNPAEFIEESGITLDRAVYQRTY